VQQPSFPSLMLFHADRAPAAARGVDGADEAGRVLESLRAKPLPGLMLRAAVPVSAARLSLVHSRDYLRAVEEGWPRALAQSPGMDWDAGRFPAACAQIGGLLAASVEAMRLRGCAGTLAGGFAHARRARGNAGCTFNGLALAAIEALARGARRVLVIDANAGCAGGTHELVADYPRIHQLDLAVSAFDRYEPTPWSSLDLIGLAADYLPTLRTRLAALEPIAPDFDLCLYAAGVDAHEQSATGGLRGIDLAMLAARERLVCEWCRGHRIPLAFAGGGGGAGLPDSLHLGLSRLGLQAALDCFCRTAEGGT
jgi:acetoin utilization deacetylase AcuC-like enzyme